MYTSVPESQISVRFALRQAIFQIEAILGQVHRMTPMTHWTLQGQIYPILVSMSPTYTQFHSTTSRFQDTCHLETRAPNDPKMTLNPTRPNVHHICVITIPVSRIPARFALRPAVLRYRPFWDQMTPKCPLNTTRSKIPHICVTSIPESQISPRFALRPAVFKISHIL